MMGLLDFILMKNLFGSSGGSSGGSGGNALCVLFDPEKTYEATTFGYFISSDVPAKTDTYLCVLINKNNKGATNFDYYLGTKFDATYIPANEDDAPVDMLAITTGIWGCVVVFDNWEGEVEGEVLSLKKGIYTESIPMEKVILLIAPNMEHL